MVNEEILDDIFTNELVVYEDIKGEKIFVKWNGVSFLIKANNLNSEFINKIDDSIENFYGKAFDYLNNLEDRVKGLLPKKWWFVFEYFSNGNINYTKKPLNNLVLTSIIKNDIEDYTVEEIEEYARLMNVECLPFIFKGTLNEKTIEAIKYFLNTSKNDLEYIFGESNFAYFFYKLLNPQLSHSFLSNDFNSNIEKIVLKTNKNKSKLELFNPLYDEISDQNRTDFVDMYSLILISANNYFQTIDLSKIKLKGFKKNELYTYVICKLFNLYIEDVGNDIKNFNLIVPEFFNKDKFILNKELLLNPLTKKQISNNKKLEYIFKCIFFSFNKEFKEPFGLITNTYLKLINSFIRDIEKIIIEYLGKKDEEALNKRGLVNAAEYFDIKYDHDSENRVYPSILDHLPKTNNDKKKKSPYEKGDFK
jgi:hypothetical protein